MSYILDALKKSEQERGHGTAPTVQTLHSSGLNYNTHKTQLWPYFLLAAIVINLAALFYFIFARSGAEATEQEQAVIMPAEPAISEAAPAVSSIDTQVSADSAAPVDTVVYKPVSLPGPGTARAVAEPPVESVNIQQVQNSIATVVEMDELPVEILQHIPVLEFSAHVYSSNPLQRSMVINGRFMEEGDRLAADLFLSEITPNGAIFDYQGQLFHRNVVSSWN